MGFSFDFTGERNVIVYQAEAGMVLDENIYRLLRSELMEEYILSFETENTSRECRFYYDITGCTNMRAWMGEHGFLEKRKMKKKIEEMQKLLTRNGIPKEMIEQEMQYMFVNDEDEEVRLVCIPLRENTYMETKRGKAEDSVLPPLPKEIPVPPENGAASRIIQVRQYRRNRKWTAGMRSVGIQKIGIQKTGMHRKNCMFRRRSIFHIIRKIHSTWSIYRI